MSATHVEFLGDAVILLRFGKSIDELLNARVHVAARALQAAELSGVGDVVPAFASIAVHYDPQVWHDPASAEVPATHLANKLCAIVDEQADSAGLESAALVEIPVCYGAEYGPDLAEVAQFAQLDPSEIISRHAAVEYRVAMLGFAPGFPYLIGLDSKLHAPRRKDPRIRVPAGSVAIGGAQTGIYPRDLPGGWQIIGRTPLILFNTSHAPPCLLAPGQAVRFRAIDTDEFAALAASMSNL